MKEEMGKSIQQEDVDRLKRLEEIDAAIRRFPIGDHDSASIDALMTVIQHNFDVFQNLIFNPRTYFQVQQKINTVLSILQPEFSQKSWSKIQDQWRVFRGELLELSRWALEDVPLENRLCTPEERGVLIDAANKLLNGNAHCIETADYFIERRKEFWHQPDASELVDRKLSEYHRVIESKEFELQLARAIEQEVRQSRTVSHGIGLLKRVLTRYGLPWNDITDSWNTQWKFGPRVLFNIQQIQTLESERPGTPAQLYQVFGLRNFNRYPTQVLLEQCRDYDRDSKAPQRPYGLVMYATNDPDGAFNIDHHRWQKLYEELQPEYALRVMEWDTTEELIGRVRVLRRRFGRKNKIRFGFVGGHGERDRITGGGKEPHRQISQENIRHPITKLIRDYFADDATIILHSCLTGEEGGIAEELRDQANITVIAPAAATHMHDIVLTKKDNTFKFKIEFTNPGEAREYKATPSMEESQ